MEWAGFVLLLALMRASTFGVFVGVAYHAELVHCLIIALLDLGARPPLLYLVLCDISQGGLL